MSGERRPKAVACLGRNPMPWDWQTKGCLFCGLPRSAHIHRLYDSVGYGILEVVWIQGEPWPA